MDFQSFIHDKGFSSVRALADAAGVNARSLEQYSTGRCLWANARAAMIVPVADALGISQSYISRLEKRILHRLKTEMEKAG